MIDLPIHIQQYLVLGLTVILLFLLFFEKIKPSVIFFSVVLLFLLFKIISTKDVTAALANESIVIIFLLIFVTSGLKNHFNVFKHIDRIFGNSKTVSSFNLKMTTSVALLSSLLNNTPIVAFFMPYVYEWSKKNNIAASKLLIPLSFAAIVGGMITVIGTSTNLVLNGLIQSKNAHPLAFSDYILPGALVTFFGILFIYLFGNILLPNRRNITTELDKNTRDYMIETRVYADSEIINKTITEAHLRNLTGVYLFEIVRNNRVITPVEPDEIILEGDALFFAGDTDNILELIKDVNGLSLPITPLHLNDEQEHELVEAVIPANSKLVGRTLKQIEFREKYDAAVVAIHRNGEKVRGKIGEINMQAGDLLLISKGSSFETRISDDSNLYLVSIVNKVSPTTRGARWGFLAILLLVLLGNTFFGLSMFIGLLAIVGYMMFTGLLSISELKKEFDIHLFIILICSLCFSTAFINTGTAEMVANSFIGVTKGYGNIGVLVGLYLITLFLTTFVTHIAAVSIVFPIAYELAINIPEMSSVAIFLAIAFAASASFHAPFSYQTNLMVYEPGNYRYKDFLKIGLPFTLLYSVVTLIFLVVYYNI